MTKKWDTLQFMVWNMFNSLRPSGAYMLGNLTTIGSANGLSDWRQGIIRTNAGILLIWP